ncbi:UNVERIFIED_ORG: purine-cytosine permease-like protein [Nocardia globerula]|uniref:Purine-cytosine permease-like protein n=1 Tax=Nocardia globerula TaxID=1818 RepID=A0A652YUI0_NOCGL|nr:cytosine permease [Rhodococcus globerulus]PVX67540.1 purine-cytosine permease-like protein [Rhodococcus globerulus]
MSIHPSVAPSSPDIGGGVGPPDAAPARPLIEQHGIDHIPESERHGSIRDLAFTWSGCILNVTTLTYGSLLVAFGLNLWQAIAAILIGNITWLIAGYLSLPGPATGMTAFMGSRAAFGRTGNRFPAVFNWIMQVGYETVNLSLMVLAATVLLDKMGIHTSTTTKISLLVGLSLLQSLLPIFGYHAITKALRMLVIPFVILFAVMAVLTVGGLDDAAPIEPGSWQLFLAGVALSASTAGLGWTGNAADYSRYLPTAIPKKRLVVGVALGGGIPQIALMILGAAVATLIPSASDPITGLPEAFASWFLVPYLIAVLLQMLAVNAFDLYSSGVTLQAIGIRVERWHAIAIDAVISALLASAIVFSDSFNTLVTAFLLFMIVWFAPWAAIYSVDFFLRRGRYDLDSLSGSSGGLYVRPHGIHRPAVIAQLAGMVAAALCIDTSIFTGPIASALGHADLSVPAGLLVGGIIYYVLARHTIALETSQQTRISA